MKLSVIVPAYNVESYIEKCLQSLHEQMMTDVEFLIINDGATDSTEKVIKNYLNSISDSRFKYYLKPNGGQADARNFGFQRAEGDYIWYVDGDDYISQDKSLLTTLTNKAIKSNLDTLIFNYRYDGHWSSKYANKVALSLKSDKEIKNGIDILDSKEFNFSVWHMLFKREMLIQNQINFEKGSTAEDLLYTVQVLLNAKKVMYDKICGYVYVYRADSITKSDNPQKIIKRINDVVGATLKIDEEIKRRNLLEINLSNLLVSGYIAQILTACAMGYVDIPRKQMKTFFKGKKLNLKQKIKKMILVYTPAKLRQKLCKKILGM